METKRARVRTPASNCGTVSVKLALVIRETNPVTWTEAVESTRPVSSPGVTAGLHFPACLAAEPGHMTEVQPLERASGRGSDAPSLAQGGAEGSGRQSHDTTRRKPPTNQKSVAAGPCEGGTSKRVGVCSCN